jgi:hypothetical protein
LAALGIYSAGILVLGRDVLLHLNTAIIGPGDFDNFYYAWSVWEFKRALLAGQLPGYTHDVFGQASSIPIFVEGFIDHVLALPLQWFLTPLGAYNVTVLLGFVLAALAMYLLASAFARSWTGCVVAGLVFSFSTYHLARALGHLGLATIEVLPFCAWRLVVFWRQPTRRTAALAGVGVGLVPWAAVNYAAYFLVPFIPLLAGAVLLSDWHWYRSRRNILLIGLALGVAVLVALPSLVDYPGLKPPDLAAIGAQASHWELRIYSVNLATLVLPDPYNPLLGSHFAHFYPTIPGVPERSAFLGAPGLLLAALALILRGYSRATLAWLTVGVVAIALALGAGARIGDRFLVPLPFYDLVYRWPLLENFGAPNRLIVLTMTAVAVLAAIGVTALLSLVPRNRLWQVGTSLAVLCFVAAGLVPNLLFGYGLTALPVRVPQLYSALAAAPNDGLVLEVPQNIGSEQYFETVSHKRLAAGIVPRLPDPAALQMENVPFYSLFEKGLELPASDDATGAANADIYPLKGFEEGLREHGISYVVLHHLSCIEPAAIWPCYELPHYAESRRFLINTLGAPFYDQASEGLTAWHVEAAPPAGDPKTSYRLGAGWIPYLGQLSDGEPRRMMGVQAEVLIESPAAGQARLQLRASSYVRPMTLEVRFNGRLLDTVRLPVGAPEGLDLGPVWLVPGTNRLNLRSSQGCVIPNDLDPHYYGPNSDGIGYRCVSFAVERVELSQ